MRDSINWPIRVQVLNRICRIFFEMLYLMYHTITSFIRKKIQATWNSIQKNKINNLGMKVSSFVLLLSRECSFMRIEVSFSLNTIMFVQNLFNFLIENLLYLLRSFIQQAKPSSQNILTNFSTTSLHDVDDRYQDFQLVFVLSAQLGKEQNIH